MLARFVINAYSNRDSASNIMQIYLLISLENICKNLLDQLQFQQINEKT